MAENAVKKAITLKEFLENTPPGQQRVISDLLDPSIQIRPQMSTPDIYLYCNHEGCQGYRNFRHYGSGSNLSDRYENHFYLTYICRNCERTRKIYAVNVIVPDERKSNTGEIYKYGEYPGFGPPTPAKTIALIGPDRELFLTGRRAENQGMGIGSFVYYRRVVENQKNRIFDEIIRVLTKTKPSDPIIEDLTKAKEIVSFSKAVESIKHALPQSLEINGQNPLTLLHTALSIGVHELNDEECLGYATSVRMVLIEFAEQLGQMLKEEAELNAAVTRLAKKKTTS